MHFWWTKGKLYLEPSANYFYSKYKYARYLLKKSIKKTKRLYNKLYFYTVRYLTKTQIVYKILLLIRNTFIVAVLFTFIFLIKASLVYYFDLNDNFKWEICSSLVLPVGCYLTFFNKSPNLRCLHLFDWYKSATKGPVKCMPFGAITFYDESGNHISEQSNRDIIRNTDTNLKLPRIANPPLPYTNQRLPSIASLNLLNPNQVTRSTMFNGNRHSTFQYLIEQKNRFTPTLNTYAGSTGDTNTDSNINSYIEHEIPVRPLSEIRTRKRNGGFRWLKMIQTTVTSNYASHIKPAGMIPEYIDKFAARNNVESTTVKHDRYHNLSHATRIKFWDPGVIKKFEFFSQYSLGSDYEKGNKALFLRILRDIMLANSVRNEDLRQPNHNNHFLIPAQSVEQTKECLAALYSNFANSNNSLINITWAKWHLKRVPLAYDTKTQYSRPNPEALEYDYHQDNGNLIRTVRGNNTDTRAFLTRALQSDHVRESPTINALRSQLNEQNNALTYNNNSQLDARGARTDETNGGINLSFLLLLSRAKSKLSRLNFFKRLVPKSFTFTNFYVISFLSLAGIVVKCFLIKVFTLDTNVFSQAFAVSVPVSVIIITIKCFILNKIEKNEHLKCPTYQRMLYISLLNILLIIVILLYIFFTFGLN